MDDDFTRRSVAQVTRYQKLVKHTVLSSTSTADSEGKKNTGRNSLIIVYKSSVLLYVGRAGTETQDGL